MWEIVSRYRYYGYSDQGVKKGGGLRVGRAKKEKILGKGGGYVEKNAKSGV